MTLLSSADWPFTGAFPLLRQSHFQSTAHHCQNESGPLQLKIRSHETPATTDLSEPLMNQALYLYFPFTQSNCSGPIPDSGHTQLLSYRFCMENNQSITMLLCSSLASPSLGPNCHIHPEAYTPPIELTLLPPAAKSNPGCSWWLNQPIWKIWSSNGIIPPGKGENQK